MLDRSTSAPAWSPVRRVTHRLWALTGLSSGLLRYVLIAAVLTAIGCVYLWQVNDLSTLHENTLESAGRGARPRTEQRDSGRAARQVEFAGIRRQAQCRSRLRGRASTHHRSAGRCSPCCRRCARSRRELPAEREARECLSPTALPSRGSRLDACAAEALTGVRCRARPRPAKSRRPRCVRSRRQRPRLLSEGYWNDGFGCWRLASFFSSSSSSPRWSSSSSSTSRGSRARFLRRPFDTSRGRYRRSRRDATRDRFICLGGLSQPQPLQAEEIRLRIRSRSLHRHSTSSRPRSWRRSARGGTFRS